MEIKIDVTPKKFKLPKLDEARIKAFLRNVGDHGKDIFLAGLSGPHSGRVRRNKNQASSAGEYPANQTGALAGSIRVSVGSRHVELSSNAGHSGYLRNGTRHMVRRKMSDTALRDAMESPKGRSSLRSGLIRWKR